MLGMLRRGATAVLFPFLAAAYPVVALYAVNLREMVPLEAMLVPLALSLSVTAVAMLLMRAAYGDWFRAGGMTVVLLILFFTYGTAWDALPTELPGGHATSLSTWVVLAILAFFLVRALGARRLRAATPALNLILAVLLVGNGVAIARFHVSTLRDVASRAEDSSENGATAAPVGQLPDIYWIILDRYGSEEVVRDYYDHDISPFLDELRTRGFYVADEATANYLKTAANLVAARNMVYLDGEEIRQRATAGDDWSPLHRDMASSFRVLEVLRPLGYQFIYLGTHWDFTASHPEADINYVFGGARDEFAGVLGDRTVLRATEALGDAAPLDWRRERWLRTHFQWDGLHDTIRLRGPKFVHAHIALPHDPYVFAPDGSFVPPDVARSRSTEENYANHVEFANTSVLDLVDALLAADPDNPPIMIIQSEEGPFPERFRADQEGFRWADDATDEELHEKFGVLATFFLPGLPGERAEEAGLYRSISLVNEFRVILNHYFGTNYELLPDRNFVWPDHSDIYEFIDVTDRVRRMTATSD